MGRFDVDYPHVRQNADIVAVLAHFDVTLIGDGEQRKGLCPFHDDTKPSLNVNTAKNVFKCHSCGSGGNIIKLVQLLDEGLSNPRLAALKIAEISGIGAQSGSAPVTAAAPRLGQMAKAGIVKPAANTSAVATTQSEPVELSGEYGEVSMRGTCSTSKSANSFPSTSINNRKLVKASPSFLLDCKRSVVIALDRAIFAASPMSNDCSPHTSGWVTVAEPMASRPATV